MACESDMMKGRGERRADDEAERNEKSQDPEAKIRPAEEAAAAQRAKPEEATRTSAPCGWSKGEEAEPIRATLYLFCYNCSTLLFKVEF